MNKRNNNKETKQSKISNRPFDPTEDMRGYMGGEADNLTGITTNEYEEGKDIELRDEYEFDNDGTWKKGSKYVVRNIPNDKV